jgi:hypothetical protein
MDNQKYFDPFIAVVVRLSLPLPADELILIPSSLDSILLTIASSPTTLHWLPNWHHPLPLHLSYHPHPPIIPTRPPSYSRPITHRLTLTAPSQPEKSISVPSGRTLPIISHQTRDRASIRVFLWRRSRYVLFILCLILPLRSFLLLRQPSIRYSLHLPSLRSSRPRTHVPTHQPRILPTRSHCILDLLFIPYDHTYSRPFQYRTSVFTPIPITLSKSRSSNQRLTMRFWRCCGISIGLIR